MWLSVLAGGLGLDRSNEDVQGRVGSCGQEIREAPAEAVPCVAQVVLAGADQLQDRRAIQRRWLLARFFKAIEGCGDFGGEVGGGLGERADEVDVLLQYADTPGGKHLRGEGAA